MMLPCGTRIHVAACFSPPGPRACWIALRAHALGAVSLLTGLRPDAGAGQGCGAGPTCVGRNFTVSFEVGDSVRRDRIIGGPLDSPC